jgi:hypothetical protein
VDPVALTDRQKRARNAEYQARWRAKRDALVKSHPEVAERVLVALAGRCDRLSEGDRLALADRLADAAIGYLRRAQELAVLARRVRSGER